MKDIPKAVREEVLERDSFDGCPCCIYCGHPFPNGKGLHLHHVKRRSQGGEHKASNLVSLCFLDHNDLHAGKEEVQQFCIEYLEGIYGNS